MNKRHSSKRMSPRTLHGFTLVELMIAMVLGLLVVGATIGVFLSNQQTYRINEGLSQIQESARTSFEILGRELRQAAGNACGTTDRLANTLNDPANSTWAEFTGVRAYGSDQDISELPEGDEIGQRVPGTHAIRIQGMEGQGLAVSNHNDTSATFQTTENNDFRPGEIMMVCDVNQTSIFQVTGPANPGSQNVQVVHNRGGSVSPGNCSQQLGYPTVCGPQGTPYQYQSNATLARFTDTIWYIGQNGREQDGGRSLYRVRLGLLPSGGAVGYQAPQEIVAGVNDMTIRAHRTGMDGWDNPSALNATAWEQVDALELTLSFLSAADRITTNPNQDAGRLSRDLTHVIALRNRLP